MSPSVRTTVTLDFNRYLLARFALDRFLPRLAAVRTHDDALALLTEAPPEGSPSHPYYDNLASFLLTLGPPPGAVPEELAAYADLAERLVAHGSMQPGAGAACLCALARAREAAAPGEVPRG